VSRATPAERARAAALVSELAAGPAADDPARGRAAELLAAAGWRTQADAAGNLIARRPGAGPSKLLLAAPGPGDNAGPLADAARRAALAALAVAAERPEHPVSVEILLLGRSRDALTGARGLDVSALESPVAFLFGHPGPIGGLVVAAPGAWRFAAELRAHHGDRDGTGAAIVAAAKAVAALPHGRLDEETVVTLDALAAEGADGRACRFAGEVRALEDERAEAVAQQVVDAVHDAANDPASECDADIAVEAVHRAYRRRRGARAPALAARALQVSGFAPREIVGERATDANALNAAGLDCACLTHGLSRDGIDPDAEADAERDAQVAVEGLLEVTLALLDAATEG
jgi:tripeptide aminopeptidase